MSGFSDLPGGNETILIVDDHETIWDFLIEALQSLGYSVLLAENGLDAAEIYEANPEAVDMVLLDMIMPKAGGHETFYRIRDRKLYLQVKHLYGGEVCYIFLQCLKEAPAFLSIHLKGQSLRADRQQ